MAKRYRCKKCGRHCKTKPDARDCAKTCGNRTAWSEQPKRMIKSVVTRKLIEDTLR